MLGDMIMDLIEAQYDKKELEKAYRRLEKVGVDRRTADVMAKEYDKDWEVKRNALYEQGDR